MNQLGGQAMVLPMGDIQLSRARASPIRPHVLSRYLDAIVLRTFDHAIAEGNGPAKPAFPGLTAFTDLNHPLPGPVRSVDDSGEKSDGRRARSPMSAMGTMSRIRSSKLPPRWG